MAPEQVHDLFERCVLDRDFEGLLSLYEQTAVAIDRDGTVVSGREAIAERYRRLLSAQLQMSGTLRKVVRAGDVAILVGDWQLEGAGPDGARISVKGRSYDVLHRQADGTWRIAVENPFDVSPSDNA
jgi:uncharacterized protein (TIGR02246 family)